MNTVQREGKQTHPTNGEGQACGGSSCGATDAALYLADVQSAFVCIVDTYYATGAHSPHPPTTTPAPIVARHTPAGTAKGLSPRLSNIVASVLTLDE